jgi:hypothetical protein
MGDLRRSPLAGNFSKVPIARQIKSAAPDSCLFPLCKSSDPLHQSWWIITVTTTTSYPALECVGRALGTLHISSYGS